MPRSRHFSTSSCQSLDFDYNTDDPMTKDLFNRLDTVKGNIQQKLPHIYHDNNVLVIGAHNVGKSSLINSVWLAMSGQNEERAPPVGVTFHLGHHKLYTRDPRYSKERGVRFPGGSVQLWDTRGFHLIHEESKAALIMQYLLEGRLDRTFFHQALMLDEEKLKQRFSRAEVSPRKHYKAIIFVERKDATDEQLEQTERLAKIVQLALAKSQFNKIKNMPVIRALNGADDEVKQLAKVERLMSNVSSTESLNEIGLSPKTHNLESYQWRVEYEGFDDEGFGNDQATGARNSIPELDEENQTASDSDEEISQRFEFSNRYGPDVINPEQHLSLLLFLNDLLQVLIDPNCESAKAWRLEKDKLASVTSASACTVGNVLKMIFGGKAAFKQPGLANFPKN